MRALGAAFSRQPDLSPAMTAQPIPMLTWARAALAPFCVLTKPHLVKLNVER